MGTVRFLLASIVVIHHIGAVPFIGQHAVLFFYVMSGFLMTMVMQERYQYTFNGIVDFWQNRILRLYPVYLAIIAFSVLAFCFIGRDKAIVFHWAMSPPQTITSWFQNLTMAFPSFTPNEIAPRISPPAWALSVELFFYFLISIGISKTKLRSQIWIGISLLLLATCITLGAEKKWYYFSIIAGSLPFSIGATIYFYKEKFDSYFQRVDQYAGLRWLVYASLLLISLISIRFLLNSSEATSQLSILTLPLTSVPAALTVIAFINGKVHLTKKRIDIFLGDLSYPIYISHFLIMFITGTLLSIEKPAFGQDSVILFLVAYPITLLFSWWLVRTIDQPISTIRQRVRNRSEKRSATPHKMTNSQTAIP